MNEALGKRVAVNPLPPPQKGEEKDLRVTDGTENTVLSAIVLLRNEKRIRREVGGC
jgi:hypothetical protein